MDSTLWHEVGIVIVVVIIGAAPDAGKGGGEAKGC